MSALLVDSATVASLVHADTTMGARLALGMLMVKLAQALAVSEGRDPHAAALVALKRLEVIIGFATAEDVALKLDVETEQQSEDAEQVEREREFERDVPWGTP